MSQEALNEAITRMATDSQFAAAVQVDADTALAGLELSADERQTLMSLAPDTGGSMTRLAPRSSKSALFFGSALHDAASATHHAAAHATGHAGDAGVAGATPLQQAVAWGTSMDPGAEDPEEALESAAQVLQIEESDAESQAPDVPDGVVPPEVVPPA